MTTLSSRVLGLLGAAPSAEATHRTWPQLSTRRQDALALAALALLVLLLHAELVLANTSLADFDLMGYFYPYWQMRHEALRAGVLPLWNPHLFTGAPFLGNIQTAVFYPLNWPLIPFDAPRAIALSYAAHIWLAGAGMYALLRVRLGAQPPAALGGALVFGLGGFLAAQAGHINQVQAASWVPLLMLTYLQAHARRSLRWAVAGGAVLACSITAGHPQESYLSLAAIGGLAAYEGWRCAYAEPDSWFNRRFADREWFILRMLAWGAFSGLVLAIMLLVGGALSAAQLLPAAELSGQGIRSGGLPYDAAVSFSLAPWEMLRALLPTHGEPPLTEFIATPGVVALGLCLAALLRWPWHRYTLYFLLLCFGGIVMAVGNFAFWYPWVYDFVPGVNLFRVPARWLFLTAFGAAGLAGIGLQALLTAAPAVVPSRRSLLAAGIIAASVAAVAVLPAWSYASLGLLYAPAAGVITLWFLFGIPAGVLAIGGMLVWRHALAGWLLLGLLVVELPLARAPMPVSHPLPATVFQTVRPGLSQLVQDPDRFRLLTLANPAFEPGDLKELRALFGSSLTDQEVRLAVEALKYQDIVVPNTGMLHGLDTLDAYDGGMLPTKEYALLKRDILNRTGRIPSRDNRASEAKEAGLLLRDAVGNVPDAVLLGGLNVKYLVADRLTDVWVDGVYHDLTFNHTVRSGQTVVVPLELERPLPDGATAISITGYLEGAQALPQGALAGTVTAIDLTGERVTVPLRAGIEIAESSAERLTVAAHQAPASVIDRRWMAGHHVYAAKATFPRPLHLKEVRIEGVLSSGAVTVNGLAVLDTRTGASYAPSLHPQWPRVYTGDTKLYRNTAFAPRAYVPAQVQQVADADAQRAAVFGLAADAAVVTAGEAAAPQGPVRGTVKVTEYGRERVDLAVELDRPGLVVLRDSFYPGWRATVDGVDAPVLRANYLFRSVEAPAGKHTVVFRYLPTHLQLGLNVSLWATVFTVAALLGWPAFRWLRRLRERKGSAAPP